MWRNVKNAGAWYMRCLTDSPYTTNAVTGFIIASAGDIISQKYFETHNKPNKIDQSIKPETIDMMHYLEDVDCRRVLEMGLIRAFVNTPFTLYWYGVLLRLAPGQQMISVLKRVAIDQVIGMPTVIMLVFGAKATLKGDPLSTIDMAKNNLYQTWLCGLQFWPIMHTINFRFIPLIYQPLYATIVSLYWNAVLSYYANKQETVVIDSSNININTQNIQT